MTCITFIKFKFDFFFVLFSLVSDYFLEKISNSEFNINFSRHSLRTEVGHKFQNFFLCEGEKNATSLVTSVINIIGVHVYWKLKRIFFLYQFCATSYFSSKLLGDLQIVAVSVTF
jgi:hypothetical protein